MSLPIWVVQQTSITGSCCGAICKKRREDGKRHLRSSSVYPLVGWFERERMSISSHSISRVVPTIWKERSGIGVGGRKMMVVECSSRPQKKATAHHIKTRPKKHQPWDIKRKPTVYEPLATLPPDWTLLERPDPTTTTAASSSGEAIDAIAKYTKEAAAAVVSPAQ